MNKEPQSLKIKIQKLGTALSNMVMPNIPALIAWGILTALFIPDGWIPNKEFNNMVGPMLAYLIPILIAYTAGKNIYDHRGGVVGAIGAFGAITVAQVGAGIPMILGAMIIGPLGGWMIMKFDKWAQPKVKAGFEMLVNNFSAGIIGFLLSLVSYLAIGPAVEALTNIMAKGVDTLINAHLIPLANVFIEPAKILFLNNAINHGILTPLGTEQAQQTGKSLLFLLEANPGPGLGILLAYMFFGRGSAKATAPGAAIIHFFGGIHEIYFPYVMMKPSLFLAVIGGGVAGTAINSTLGAGLRAPASPGSIIAILGMTPKGAGSFIAVISGILGAAIVSFLIASLILKRDKSEESEDEFEKAKDKVSSSKNRGKESDSLSNPSSIKHIIFACDAGMGSSAMGASILRDKVKKAGLDIDVTNLAIANLKDNSDTLIVTQKELNPRARTMAPSSQTVWVSNFLNSPKYDEIVTDLLGQKKVNEESQIIKKSEPVSNMSKIDVKRVIFAHDGKSYGSTTMGKTIFEAILKNNNLNVPVISVDFSELGTYNQDDSLIISKDKWEKIIEDRTPKARHLGVDSLVTTPEYDKIIERIKK
ncbi:PTS mannitol transporter subunit IICBA [Streptococcaceae bacterium ESL0729]|nr:PTS mannitol transporter subunit IICBA [Streptococcaceae bacterium ESL0729]